jgi:hypothetical protein
MAYDENNTAGKNTQNDTPLKFEERLNYLKDILASYHTQLQTLDHRLSYILGGNGVVLGVELYFVLSPNQCPKELYIPLLISLCLIAVSSIIAVIGNMSGYFLIRLGGKIKEQDLGAVNRADDNLESLKFMTQEGLLKRMFQEKTLFKMVIKVKLRMLTLASWFLIANFLTILVLIFIKYYCLPS